MEANVCDVNRLDSDVLLPPRKRLLACLKKQNGDINQTSNSQSTCTPLSKLDTRISYLLRSHLTTDNPSQEEIVAASKSAAEVAVKLAMAARSLAEEKAVIASKAMAAAKKALELVAIVDDQEQPPSSPDSKKNNKQVEVQMLYNNKKPRLENGNDEELARKLHQAINSSPRISKSGVHHHKHKKVSENDRISKIGEEISISISISPPSENNTTNGDRIESKVDEMSKGSFGRKRGRMKQKKLPLSICHDKDQSNPNKEDHHHHHHTTTTVGMPAGSSSNVVERNLWKCQTFKASSCVKQNKVMQL